MKTKVEMMLRKDDAKHLAVVTGIVIVVSFLCAWLTAIAPSMSAWFAMASMFTGVGAIFSTIATVIAYAEYRSALQDQLELASINED